MYEAREPTDLMRAGHDLCFDRSHTFDKGMNFLGFESKHVYVLHRQNRTFLSALINRGQASHAVSEVKTSKGWMFADSNTVWSAVKRAVKL